MASPASAGCAALLLQENAALTPAQIEARLKASPVSVTDTTNGLSFPRIDCLAGAFGDVPPSHWAWSYIQALFDAGITSGCSPSPPLYCPNAPVTRAQMAVFIILALNETPVTPTGVFDDLPPSHFAAGFIEKLADLGITSGCGGGNYCPNDPVTRAQMAVFIVVALGEAPVGSPIGVFGDVPPSHWAAGFIERLAQLEITAGCSISPSLYCPNASVTRAQMAVFIVVAFNLLPP